MNKTYRRWARGFLAVLLGALALCGGIVYAVDPCLYYRMPEGRLPVFFNERYQTAGMIRNVPADTVLLGTSITANYRASRLGELYGGSGLRITLPDGRFSEFDQAVDLLFREHPPKRILFALDLNTLVRDEGGAAGAMPEYLYNRNPLDDVKYLLNKDSLYYSVYALLAARRGGGQTLDEGFAWDGEALWGKYQALRFYERPPAAGSRTPEDAYLGPAAENLAVLEGWFREHPETEFEVFLSPYSILAWDKAIRLGDLDARLAAVKLACGTLAAYPNVRMHAPLFDRDIVTDLRYYCDYIHHSGEAGRRVLEGLRGGSFLLRPEDADRVLAQWREFAVSYDYDGLWDREFWDCWNAEHDGPPAWYEG